MNALQRKVSKLRRPTGDNDVVVLARADFRRLRPSRHPIVMGLWCAFGTVSTLQLIHGVAPTSINSHLEQVVQIVLAGMVIVGTLLNLVGAWVRDDSWALGMEIGGLILLGTAFVVYALAIAGNTEFWAATIGAAWSIGMLAGTLGRTVQIFRRGW